MAEEAVTPEVQDPESDLDGCDVEVAEATLDEDLPVTEGGVR